MKTWCVAWERRGLSDIATVTKGPLQHDEQVLIQKQYLVILNTVVDYKSLSVSTNKKQFSLITNLLMSTIIVCAIMYFYTYGITLMEGLMGWFLA